MLRPRRSLRRFDSACRRSASTTGSRPNGWAGAAVEPAAGYASPSRSRAVWYKRAGAGDRLVGVPGKLRIRELLEAAHQRDDGETGQSVRAVPHDVVRVQAFPWPVPRPLELRRDLLFERQAVVDLPPVGQRFAGAAGYRVAACRPSACRAAGGRRTRSGTSPRPQGTRPIAAAGARRARGRSRRPPSDSSGPDAGRERSHQLGAERLPVRKLPVRQLLGETKLLLFSSSGKVLWNLRRSCVM